MNIKPYTKNAKKHPDNQLKLIAKSLKEFGWQQPIVVDKNGVIIVGHGRWFAYEKFGKEMKLLKPEIKQANNLTKQQVKAYRLADNKLNESDWDMELAIEELKELDSKYFDLTGFDKDLLVEPDDKDDEIPDDAPAVSKLGEIWQLGKHRLMCGDSTNIENVKKLMNGHNADLVFTDPPYNVNYSGTGENTSNKILNDKMGREKFGEFLNDAFKRLDEASKSSAPWYVCHSHTSQIEFEKGINKGNRITKTQIIWEKPSATLGWQEYRNRHEPIFYCVKEGQEIKFYGDRTYTTIWKQRPNDNALLRWINLQIKSDYKGTSTIWTIGRDNVNEYKHPTQKPVALITRAIINSSKVEDLVVDTFLGSGSTLIASEKTNRICYGMELDPKYTDVIIKRYENYTGNKAEKIKENTVKTRKYAKIKKK